MKCLSVRQPWANLIASGQKTIETRTWATTYRGPLVIVSSKSPRIEPAGAALALVDLVECRPMVDSDQPAACCDIYPGAFAWVLRKVRRIGPIPLRGSLGIYDADIAPEVIGARSTG